MEHNLRAVLLLCVVVVCVWSMAPGCRVGAEGGANGSVVCDSADSWFVSWAHISVISACSFVGEASGMGLTEIHRIKLSL